MTSFISLVSGKTSSIPGVKTAAAALSLAVAACATTPKPDKDPKAQAERYQRLGVESLDDYFREEDRKAREAAQAAFEKERKALEERAREEKAFDEKIRADMEASERKYQEAIAKIERDFMNEISRDSVDIIRITANLTEDDVFRRDAMKKFHECLVSGDFSKSETRTEIAECIRNFYNIDAPVYFVTPQDTATEAIWKQLITFGGEDENEEKFEDVVEDGVRAYLDRLAPHNPVIREEKYKCTEKITKALLKGAFTPGIVPIYGRTMDPLTRQPRDRVIAVFIKTWTPEFSVQFKKHIMGLFTGLRPEQVEFDMSDEEFQRFFALILAHEGSHAGRLLKDGSEKGRFEAGIEEGAADKDALSVGINSVGYDRPADFLIRSRVMWAFFEARREIKKHGKRSTGFLGQPKIDGRPQARHYGVGLELDEHVFAAAAPELLEYKSAPDSEDADTYLSALKKIAVAALEEEDKAVKEGQLTKGKPIPLSFWPETVETLHEKLEEADVSFDDPRYPILGSLYGAFRVIAPKGSNVDPLDVQPLGFNYELNDYLSASNTALACVRPLGETYPRWNGLTFLP